MSLVKWKSPSNIAIVKYWGKHGRQLPNNPSISFTLSEAHTITSLGLESKTANGSISLDFLFEGNSNPAFANKISKFLGSIANEHFPFLFDYHLTIESQNTFPHSSGIASSASSMSALAMCLVDHHRNLCGYKYDGDSFLQKASLIARLGSGSACRSVFPIMGLWGYHSGIDQSSDGYAIDMSQSVHSVFKGFHDDILIISADEKSVSSTAGHNLMVNNPYADARYAQASDRCILLLDILKAGDVPSFGKICEDEAMTLHALMMCSDPSYILLKEGTLSAIEKIRDFRLQTGSNLYFTLDAGPNVHLLYPNEEAFEIQKFIETELLPLCNNGRIIRDFVGKGPSKQL
jgi:diphosphomevalonate decarboxylase